MGGHSVAWLPPPCGVELAPLPLQGLLPHGIRPWGFVFLSEKLGHILPHYGPSL
jgi:hypothetical protein